MRFGRLTGIPGLLVLTAVLTGCTSVVTGTASPASALQTALLRLHDLPAGWTEGQEPPRDSGMMTTYRACLGLPTRTDERLEVAVSPYFVDDGGNTLSSAASRYPPERIAEDTAGFGDVRAPDCFGRALTEDMKAHLPLGAAMGTPDVSVVPGNGDGPSNVVAIVTAGLSTTSSTGVTSTLCLQYWFLTGRSAEAVVGFSSRDALLPHGLTIRAVTAVAERIAAL